ncbi:MAG: hypothetical protein NTV04_13560, partial [Deltaproteobacteria bacterium]|nr:hypothetical protein [Deltaproteobacteria bacterium]
MDFKKYSTFLELNCQSILLGRTNTPLTPPFFPGPNYFWIISNLVEKKTGLFSEKDLFSVGSANREDSLRPSGSMPGQKSIRLAKKGGDPSFPDAGFRRFSPGIPFPPRLF